MLKFPTELAVVLLTVGSAMLLVCIIGKVEVKEIKLGTNKRWARLLLGGLGTVLIVLSLASYVELKPDVGPEAAKSPSNVGAGLSGSTASALPYQFNRSLKEPVTAGGSFTWGDATKNGKRVPNSLAIEENIIKIATQLEKIKKEFFPNRKIVIVEWYRDLPANQAVGGERSSLHLQGSAIRFRVEGVPSTEVYEVLDQRWEGGLGVYTNQNYVQIDLRPRVRWIN